MKRFLAAGLAAFCPVALAVQSVSFETGRGTRAVDLWRVGAQWAPHPEWLEGSRWSVYLDLSLGGWHGDSGTVHDLGLTPVWRYARAPRGPYFEGAIGVHVLSDEHISRRLDFSTHFQFGDHVGVGYRLENYDWSLRLQHLSNGGIANPNPGINFLVLRVQYHFR
jgi:lipid A 3-O-deacylase